MLHKQIDHLDDHVRRLIALSPFVVLGTQGPRGFDCSPKGGEPGFIQVKNDKTLLLPDRGGNNRLDGLTNLLHHPFAGLLFLIPGWSECFRVNGRAQISVDPALCALLASPVCGKAVDSTIRRSCRRRWRCSRRTLPCIRRRNSESALSARRSKQTRQTVSVAITPP
nr:pyridoxamine 5'-phosphate oxidase family protein [Candidatus Sodalis pierantonius]